MGLMRRLAAAALAAVLLLSTALGFALGFLCARLTALLFRSANRSGTENFFARAQICGGAATAFMHGAQVGQ